MGFEPTRAEHNGLAVHRLNHSATSSLLEYLPDSFMALNRIVVCVFFCGFFSAFLFEEIKLHFTTSIVLSHDFIDENNLFILF